MLLRRSALLLVPLLAAGVAPAVADFISTADTDFISSDALAKMNLAKSWQTRVPLADGQMVVDAFLVDDQIYATTNDGYAFAIHAPTGAIRWVKQVTRGGYRLTRPCHIRDRTVFVTAPRMLQYDRVYGTAIRATELRFPAGSPPASDQVTIFVGGIDGRIYDFQANTDYPIWKASTGGQIVAQPAIYDVALFVASDDGRVYAGRRDNRALLWRSARMGPISANLVVDESGVYVASRDRSLYLLELGSGAVRWRARLGSPLTAPPLVTPTHVYQASESDGVACIDPGGLGVQQRVRWMLAEARSALSVDGDAVYMLSRDQSLLRVRSADGSVLESANAAGFELFMPSPGEAAVYLADARGRVFCARLKGAPVPSARDVLAAMSHARPAAPRTDSPPEAPAVDTGDPTATRHGGTPVGGKSKVTRDLLGGGAKP